MDNKYKKYNKKMTDMIQHAYKTAAEGTSQIDTAKRILEDYKALWPSSPKIANMTPAKIRSKYHTLKTQGVYIATVNETVKKPISSRSTMKDFISAQIQEAEDMTYNVKRNKITITYTV